MSPLRPPRGAPAPAERRDQHNKNRHHSPSSTVPKFGGGRPYASEADIPIPAGYTLVKKINRKCHQYEKGRSCGFGDKCLYLHDQEPLCIDYCRGKCVRNEGAGRGGGNRGGVHRAGCQWLHLQADQWLEHKRPYCWTARVAVDYTGAVPVNEYLEQFLLVPEEVKAEAPSAPPGLLGEGGGVRAVENNGVVSGGPPTTVRREVWSLSEDGSLGIDLDENMVVISVGQETAVGGQA